MIVIYLKTSVENNSEDHKSFFPEKISHVKVQSKFKAPMNRCDGVKLSSIIDRITLQKNVVLHCTIHVITDHFIVYHYLRFSKKQGTCSTLHIEATPGCFGGILR